MIDSASVWYGLFDGRRWRRLVRISVAYHARLLPETSSALVVTGRGLAFAYPYDHARTLPSTAQPTQGLVLFSENGVSWTSDTLLTWEAPGAVQLVSDASAGVLAVYSQSYFTDGHARGPVLFSAVHDSAGWKPPGPIWQPTSGYVNAPLGIASVRDTHNALRTIVSWETSTSGLDADSLTWGAMETDGTLRRIGHSIATYWLDGTSVSATEDGGAIWLARNDTVPDELRLVHARDTTIDNLGTVNVPFDNAVPVASTLADGRLIVATMRVHLAKPQSATTYLTELAVGCPAARK